MSDEKKTKQQLLSELRAMRELVSGMDSGDNGDENTEATHAFSARFYRRLIENALDAVAVLRPDGTVHYVGPSLECILGHEPGEMVGRNGFENIHPEDRAVAEGILDHLLQEKGSTAEAEIRAKHKDGSWRTLQFIARNLLDDTDVKGILISYRDITQRELTELALSESERKYEALIENAIDGVVIVQDELCVFANRAMAEMTRYTVDELIGMHFQQLIVPEYKATDAKLYRSRVAGEEVPSVHPSKIERKDGGIVEIEVSAAIIQYQGGPATMAIVRDVTKRSELEQAVRESEERYHLIAEHTSDFIVVTTLDGVYTYVSPSHRQLGYEPEDLLGKSGRDFAHPDDMPRLAAIAAEYTRERITRAIESGHSPTQSTEYRFRDKHGQWHDIETRMNYVRHSDGKDYSIIYISRDVTERKRAAEELEELVQDKTRDLRDTNRTLREEVQRHRNTERELQESERRFRAIVEATPVPVIITRRSDGLILYVNDHFNRAFGTDNQDILNRRTLDFFAADNERAKMLEEIRAKGCLSNYEFHGQVPGDADFWVIVSLQPLTFESEDALLSGFIDVTDWKRAENDLRNAEQYYKSLLENAMDVIVLIRDDVTIGYESSSIRRVLGYGLEDVIDRNGFDFVHPDDIDRAKNVFGTLINNPDETQHIELRVIDKTGSWHIVECLAKSLLHDPAVRGITVNFRDITERRKAEEDLRQSEERYRILAENARDVIWTVDMELRFTYVSPSITPLLGYGVQEAISASMDELLTPASFAAAMDAFDEERRIERGHSKSASRSRTLELELKRKDGSTVWTEAVAVVMRDEYFRPKGILGVARDISERKRAREEIREAYEKEKHLREQIEVEMKSRVEFTRALTHELKTPLTSILASSDMLITQLHEEPAASLARNINWGATNLNDRIEELLDLARLETGMLELKVDSVDLVQLLHETASRMVPVAETQGQTLNVSVPPALPQIQGDAPRLQQVVLNLLDNAIKFTPRGGRISLHAREVDSSVVVEVQDTGRGLPDRELSRLFEPYYRLQSGLGRQGGLGLGLALCKTLVELHNGDIWAKSQMGKGSIFGFSLPLQRAAEEVAEPRDESKLWRVLIIEDDQTIVDTISLAFQIHWPEAQLVSTRLGEEGVEAVESEAPDIVILDLGLPDMDGFDVLQQVRLFSSVPVIVLTVKADEADVIRGLELGADDYIAKPFRQMELLSRLKVQLRKQTQPDEETPIVCGPLRFEPTTSQLTYGARDISLTTIEGRIIQHLMRNSGHIVTHSRLAEAVWGEDYPGAVHSLRVNIQRLRSKVEQDPSNPSLIVTKPGVGYSLAKPA